MSASRLLLRKRSATIALLLVILTCFLLAKMETEVVRYRLRKVADATIQREREACPPKTRLAFAKTHKTGGSTLQNILLRFGLSNNLTFALPRKGWTFSLREPFSSSDVANWTPGEQLDLFLFHSVWNHGEVQKVVPGAAAITLLRDPVDCFESNYVYMGLQKRYKMDINEFAKRRAAMGVGRRNNSKVDKNQQLWDLGVTLEDSEQKETMLRKIRQLDVTFDLVLITEMFEESLVLMAERLCWRTTSKSMWDLTFLRLNRRVEGKSSNMTSESRATLRRWLWAEQMVYDHFREKLKRNVRRFGKKMMERKVRALRAMNARVTEDCVEKVGSNEILSGDFRMALPIVEGYVIKGEQNPWCALYARSEPSFTRHLGSYQTLLMEARKLRRRIS